VAKVLSKRMGSRMAILPDVPRSRNEVDLKEEALNRKYLRVELPFSSVPSGRESRLKASGREKTSHRSSALWHTLGGRILLLHKRLYSPQVGER